MSEFFRVVESAGQVTRQDDLFPCSTLHCSKVLARVCIARQRVGDIETRDTWRGQAARYPHCVTRRCAEGRLVRSRIGERPELAGDRRERPRVAGEAAAVLPPQQRAAKRRLEAVGLLDEVPFDLALLPVPPRIPMAALLAGEVAGLEGAA